MSKHQTPAPVTPAVLRWAVDESGSSIEEIANRVGVARETLQEWADGGDAPTRGQLNRLADALKRPASIFYLPEPPPLSLPPNLRVAQGRVARNLNADELKQVRRARRTQRFLNLLLREIGTRSVDIPPFEVGSDPNIAAEGIRWWLGVSNSEQLGWESTRHAFAGWRSALEARGVLVMQLRLGRSGLRGFSLRDDLAPVAAVNTAENVQARIFTLLHEVMHLSSDSGSACLEGVTPSGSAGQIERWCDRVASAALIPRELLKSEFRSVSSEEFAALDDARTLADRFHASLRATALALISGGLATPELYGEIERAYPSTDYEKGFGRGAGQRAPQQRLSEVGPRAASLFMDALADARMSEREARQYLRLDGAELSELATAVGAQR